jgi:hypothetical protein
VRVRGRSGSSDRAGPRACGGRRCVCARAVGRSPAGKTNDRDAMGQDALRAGTPRDPPGRPKRTSLSASPTRKRSNAAPNLLPPVTTSEDVGPFGIRTDTVLTSADTRPGRVSCALSASVSATVHHAAYQHEHEASQVTARRWQPSRAVQCSLTPFRATRRSQSAPR